MPSKHLPDLEDSRALIDGLSSDQFATELSHRLLGYQILKVSSAPGALPLTIQPAPITLLPTPFPKELYERGKIYTELTMDLTDAMVRDVEWLTSAYRNLEKVDEFVQKFMQITREVYVDGPKDIEKSLRGYVIRSDYLRDASGPEEGLKQVEVNLSSVVGTFTSQQVTKFHQHLLNELGRPERLESNATAPAFVESMERMLEAYRNKFSIGDHDEPPILLYVPGPHESNSNEIRNMTRLCFDANIPFTVCDFDYLTTLYSEKKALHSTTDKVPRLKIDLGALGTCAVPRGTFREIGVVYFRTAYRPEQYPTPEHWELRKYLETGETIVVPSAISQLAGLKKVQQLWCEEVHLERLVPEKSKRDVLQQSFVDQVDPSVRDDRTHAVVQEALQHPERFVLKPQREGGANNYYNDEISPLLRVEMESNTSAFVLMRKINAPGSRNIFLRDGRLTPVEDTISEIGYFRSGLWDGTTKVFSKDLGHLLRTKPRTTDEGGVSMEAAVYDTPLVV